MLLLPTFRPPSRLAVQFIELVKQTHDRLLPQAATMYGAGR